MTEPEIPRMFRPDSFPSFLTFEEGPEYDGPAKLAGRKMDTPAVIFNRTFNSAVGRWGLPPPQIEEGEDGDIGQSDAEIVQNVYLKPRGPCQQFEMFFTAAPLYTQRNTYGQMNRVPYEGMTLNEMQQHLVGDTNAQFELAPKLGHGPIRKSWADAEISEIVHKYNPMGFFFAYVEDRMKNQSGMDVAYTCGSLCDILNVWHVPIVPGMRLYIVLMWVTADATVKPRKMFVPFASLGRPENDPAFRHVLKLAYDYGVAHTVAGKNPYSEYAVIDIGTVCVSSNQPAQMLPGHSFVSVAAPQPVIPAYSTSSLTMTTDPVQIKNNILRVNVEMLQWVYYA